MGLSSLISTKIGTTPVTVWPPTGFFSVTTGDRVSSVVLVTRTVVMAEGPMLSSSSTP